MASQSLPSWSCSASTSASGLPTHVVAGERRASRAAVRETRVTSAVGVGDDDAVGQRVGQRLRRRRLRPRGIAHVGHPQRRWARARGVEAERGGGREVEALGAAVDRDPDPVVGGAGELGGQPPGLVAEQPGGRAARAARRRRRGRPRRRRRRRARSRPAAWAAADRGERVGLDRDREVEQAADAGPHGLGVVGVDRVAGQHDGVGAGRVGGADHGAGVAGVADVGADRRPGRVDRRGASVERDVEEAADRDHAGRGDAVAERGQRPVVDQGPGRAPAAARSAYCSVAAGVANTSTTQPGTASAPATAFGPSARKSRRSARTGRRLSLRASLTRALPAGQRAWSGASGRRRPSGALTSSGSAALAVSTSALNAATSLTARSARILRSTSTPARFRPWMNRL